MSIKPTDKSDTDVKSRATDATTIDLPSTANTDSHHVYNEKIDKASQSIEEDNEWLSRESIPFHLDPAFAECGGRAKDHKRYAKITRSVATHFLTFFKAEIEPMPVVELERLASTFASSGGIEVTATNEEWDRVTEIQMKKRFHDQSKAYWDTQPNIDTLETCRKALRRTHSFANPTTTVPIDRIFDAWCLEGTPEKGKRLQDIMNRESSENSGNSSLK